MSSPAPSVSRVCALPSARMIQIDSRPSRVDEKTMRDPSGENIGSRSSARPSVSGVSPLPSARATKMTRCPSRVFSNTMRVPSGDHCRCALATMLSVMRVAPEPSAFITQSSHVADCCAPKASFVPSGDQSGKRFCSARVVSRVRCAPSSDDEMDLPVAVALGGEGDGVRGRGVQIPRLASLARDRQRGSLRSLGMTGALRWRRADDARNGIAMRCMAAARVRGKLPNQMPAATRALRLGCLSTAGPRITTGLTGRGRHAPKTLGDNDLAARATRRKRDR